MKISQLINISLFLILPQFMFAQIIPGAKQSKAVLITGATAHIGNGKVVEKASILFEDGVVKKIGKELVITEVASSYDKIDATGKHVYPGFIAMNTRLGLVDIDAVRATRDFRGVGGMNPHVRALIAYNTDSKILPTVRTNGVMMAQICPEGNGISGQSSLMALDGWNWQDAVITADQGIHLSWPRDYRRTGWWAEPGGIKRNVKYGEQVEKIESYLVEAKAYAKDNPKTKDLRMEAMKGLFDKTKKLYVQTNGAKTIEAAVLMAQRIDVEIVIVGGNDAWQVVDFLKSYNVPVVLNPPQSLPNHTDAHIDQPFKTAGMLASAGVTVAIAQGESWQNFNLPFQTGQAVAFGMDKEAAIQAITLNPAKIMGVDKMHGSLEPGKSATLFICDGDALDMRTNNLTKAWINGREVDLDNHHKILARKYNAKYEQLKSE